MAKDEEIRGALDELVLSSIEYADECENGSAEKQAALDDASKAYKMHLEQQKVDNEKEDAKRRYIEEVEKRQQDMKFRDKQLKQQHQEARNKMIADIAVSGVKLAFLGYVQKWTFGLEQIGNLSSATGKNLFRKAWDLIDFKTKF